MISNILDYMVFFMENLCSMAPSKSIYTMSDCHLAMTRLAQCQHQL